MQASSSGGGGGKSAGHLLRCCVCALRACALTIAAMAIAGAVVNIRRKSMEKSQCKTGIKSGTKTPVCFRNQQAVRVE
jgi:hypothetical protein